MSAYRGVAFPCPSCGASLERAGATSICRTCRGLWVDEPSLDEMLRTMHHEPSPPAFVPRVAAARLPCPHCTRPLEPVALENVPVDRCPGKHGVWFDAGELQQALYNAAPRVPDAEPGAVETTGEVLDLLGTLLAPFD